MPSLFRTVYHLPVQLSITYGFIISGVGLCGSFLAIYLNEASGRGSCLS